MKKPDINIIANSLVSHNSIGGGDRIFIELAGGWRKKGYNLNFFVCAEGYKVCRNNSLNLHPTKFNIISNFDAQRYGVILAYIFRVFKAFITTNIDVASGDIIYSSSDFLPDVIPAREAKIRDKSLRWIAGFYLRAPNPFKKECMLNIRTVLYYLTQLISIYLMKKYSDLIFVLCEEDKAYLENFGIRRDKVIVINGGVDIEYVNRINPKERIHYDGCFVGRFHKQKGVFDLIKIWQLVVEEKKDAKLAIIGWGEEEWIQKIIKEISVRQLNENIKLLGFLDGEEKFRIIKSSKVFLMPSNYESWGIVAVEAMACGLPVVTFDIPVLKRNFPHGVIRVPLYDHKEFSKNVLNLLKDHKKYEEISREARKVANRYDWKLTVDLTEKLISELMMGGGTC